MSKENTPGETGPPPRRGPTVDLDPTGIVTGKAPDRQRRQFLNYSFYRLDPVFRRLPADERRAAGIEFIELVRQWESSDDLILRTYSLVGLRADVDFMLWRIAFDLQSLQSMEAAIRRSRLGAYLSLVHSLLSLQRRSPYVNRIRGAGDEGVELEPGQGKYLFVYPFTKTRAWYRLSPHARQGMMDEHIAASAPFKGVRLNTSYSYGIDDQDFVVAFDSDYPQEFVDLVAGCGTRRRASTRSGTRRCSRARKRQSTRSSRSWRTWISESAFACGARRDKHPRLSARGLTPRDARWYKTATFKLQLKARNRLGTDGSRTARQPCRRPSHAHPPLAGFPRNH